MMHRKFIGFVYSLIFIVFRSRLFSLPSFYPLSKTTIRNVPLRNGDKREKGSWILRIISQDSIENGDVLLKRGQILRIFYVYRLQCLSYIKNPRMNIQSMRPLAFVLLIIKNIRL